MSFILMFFHTGCCALRYGAVRHRTSTHSHRCRPRGAGGAAQHRILCEWTFSFRYYL